MAPGCGGIPGVAALVPSVFGESGGIGNVLSGSGIVKDNYTKQVLKMAML